MNKLIIAVVLATACATIPLPTVTPPDGHDHGMVSYMTESLVMGSALQQLSNQVGGPVSGTTGTFTGPVTATNYLVNTGGGMQLVGQATGFSMTLGSGTITWQTNGSTFGSFRGADGHLAWLFGIDSTSTIKSTIASGSDAFAAGTNGAHWHFGAGASDYASSDGTTVTFAGSLTSAVTITALVLSLANGGNFKMNGVMSIDSNAPAISSGFGTSPSIVASNGTLGFQVNVGTGGVATSGVILMPSTASHGWICNCQDITTETTTVTYTKQTASTTTTCTVGSFTDIAGSGAWAASDKLNCIAAAY